MSYWGQAGQNIASGVQTGVDFAIKHSLVKGQQANNEAIQQVKEKIDNYQQFKDRIDFLKTGEKLDYDLSNIINYLNPETFESPYDEKTVNQAIKTRSKLHSQMAKFTINTAKSYNKVKPKDIKGGTK